MKKRIVILGLLFLVLLTFSTGVWAEEEKKASGVNVEEIKKALGLSIYLQGGYTYNFEDPD